MLRSQEKRLLQDKEAAGLYKEQMDEMVNKGIARKLSSKEIQEFKGPFTYLSHHYVMKKDSLSTSLCVVFNPSINFQGHILNEYWAKGSDFINNLT